MKISTNIVKPLSSKIDWCEPNYAFSTLIAEFWNTISNLPMIILPIFLMRLYKEYSFVVPKSRFANIVWVLLMFTGVGSAYFHSTLSMLGQFLDEMGILWVCCAVAAVWLPDLYLPKLFVGKRLHFQLAVFSGAVVATGLSFIKPEINHWFLFLFAIPAVYILTIQMKIYKSNADFQYVSHSGLICWIFSIFCWVLDRFLCPIWLQVHFPNFHGIWHILVTAGSYKACVCYSYYFAMEQKTIEKPILKFVHLHPSLTWCGLWFVGFEKRLEESVPFHAV